MKNQKPGKKHSKLFPSTFGCLYWQIVGRCHGRMICKVWFGFWHLFPKWFLCWMPWPNHFPLCAFQCLRFSFLYICLPVSHMHFWAKQVYVWQFLSAFGKERVRKLCWVSWFVSPPHGFSARCLGWMIMLPIWGLCLWICLPQVCEAWCRGWMILLDMCLSLWLCSIIFFSHSLFFSFIHTHSIWIDISL